MKKEYITPKIEIAIFTPEVLLSGSIEKIGVNEELGTDDDFNTNRRNGWENYWEDTNPFDYHH